jgi:hypothetical protein
MLTIAYVNKEGIKQDQEIKELSQRLVKKWREEQTIKEQKFKMLQGKSGSTTKPK